VQNNARVAKSHSMQPLPLVAADHVGCKARPSLHLLSSAGCNVQSCMMQQWPWTQQQDDLVVATLRPSPGRTVAPPALEAMGWLAILMQRKKQ
jgi:hypothetical protein